MEVGRFSELGSFKYTVLRLTIIFRVSTIPTN